MAKKTKTTAVAEPVKFHGGSLFGAVGGFDTSVSDLFSKSAGPVKREKLHVQEKQKQKPKHKEEEVESDEDEDVDNDEELSELDEELDDSDKDEDNSEDEDGETEKEALLDGEAVGIVDGEVEMARPDNTIADVEESSRKRKRKNDNEDLEGAYLSKLAREEAKEQAQRDAERGIKKQKTNKKDKTSGDEDVDDFVPPQHESLAPSTADNSLEQAARTVFLGNVSNSAITSKSDKKTLLTHLGSFLDSLPASTPAHKVESLRFRSIAFSSAVPKKAAFARKDIMDSTTKSTNAYAVYTTKVAAREAAKRLNGTVVLDRHIKVDEVAHPRQTDHRRCVFIGNLGFVDDESGMAAAMAEADGEKRRVKKTPPSDVEEGLWQQFSKAGKVESVRVVRDSKTRVGKGIAYVQFEDENGVEKALLFNDQKYPPLLPRKLRVTRAKKPSIARQNSTFYQEQEAQKGNGKSTRGGGPSFDRSRGGPAAANRPTAEQASSAGRAKKLLGKAGAATTSRDEAASAGKILRPESFVFEGHRASKTAGNRHLKSGGSGKKKGKPRNRSAMRGEAWKSKGAAK